MHEREEITQQILEADRCQRESGWCDAWFKGADSEVRGVAGDANGLLLEQLLAASNYVDKDFPNPLREGVCVCFVDCRLIMARLLY